MSINGRIFPDPPGQLKVLLQGEVRNAARTTIALVSWSPRDQLNLRLPPGKARLEPLRGRDESILGPQAVT